MCLNKTKEPQLKLQCPQEATIHGLIQELPKTHHHWSLQLALGLQVPLGPPLLLRTQLRALSQSDILQPRCFTAALHGKHAAPGIDHCSPLGLGTGVPARSKEPYAPYRGHSGTTPHEESNPRASGERNSAPLCTPTNWLLGAKPGSRCLKVWDLEVSSKFNPWKLQ